MTAAAARKLQKDIDVVLKKVEDGIDEFDMVWEQATTSSNNAQKEKLGEELKRSINKLQRLRAQIREWIAQSDIKNNSKDKLEEARKRIENDMQRFKEFERDLKTKAFSTCALAKADELELEEAEKIRYQEWLVSTIQVFNDQQDELEADLEALGNKKSMSNDERGRQTQLKLWQERHRWHINKLELILRALDNNSIDMTDLAVVRESVEVYIDNHEDPDYGHDDSLYDCFDLTEFEEKVVKPRSPSTDTPKENSTASSKEEPQKKGKEKEKRKKDDKKDRKKEERDKKAAATSPTVGAAGCGNAKVAAGNNGRPCQETKIGSPSLGVSSPMDIDQKADNKLERRVLDDINLDEVKVQEDQLLSEAEEFICKICQIHVVGCSPKLTNCSHLFCGDCIAQWFSQHPESQTWAQRARSAGPERVVPCPVCKQPLNEKRDLYPVCGATSRSENLLLWRMLSSLKIMCVNHAKLRSDGKCDWIGEYGQYQKHITGCNNLPLQENGSSNAPVTPTVETPTTVAHQRKESKTDPSDANSTTDRSLNNTPVASDRSPNTRPLPAATPVQTPQLKAAPPAHISSPCSQGQTKPAKATPEHSQKVSSAPAQPASVPMSNTGALVSAANMATPSSPPSNAPVQHHGTAQTQSNVATNVGNQHSGVSAAATAPATQDVKATQQEADGSFITHATSAFEPTGPNMLCVQAGDAVQVLERHTSGWSYCKNLVSSSTGWAPAWVVQPVHGEEASASIPKARAQEAPTKDPSRTQQTPQLAASPVSQPQAASPTATPKAPQTMVRAAASAFTAASPSQLTLAQNDLVEIIERHASGWTYGRKVSHGQTAADAAAPCEGWFPDWVCGQK